MYASIGLSVRIMSSVLRYDEGLLPNIRFCINAAISDGIDTFL